MVSASTSVAIDRARGWQVVAALSLGYIGVYLCRKNLSVAVPLLQPYFHATKQEVGAIASAGTLAYAAGKLCNGVLVDRIGGRLGFLGAVLAVAIFGGASAFAPSLGVVTVLYAMNRFAGAGGWGAMVKLVPTWFGTARTASVIAIMSLSYVLGGVAALLLAREIVARGGGWRAVMGLPAIATLVTLAVAAVFARPGPLHAEEGASKPSEAASREKFFELVKNRQFLIACGISFAITLMREAVNNWSVDFLVEVQGPRGSVAKAALGSIGFDLAGAIAIMVNGLLYDRLSHRGRSRLMAVNLVLLTIVLLVLPAGASANLYLGAALLGAVGLLVYGPFSLLSGVIAVETGGARLAATAAGIIDGVGYLAAVLAGAALGRVIDIGGYRTGFGVLAVIVGVAAVIAIIPSRRAP
jgi:sugar phosphate permease